jgi:GST-like protein
VFPGTEDPLAPFANLKRWFMEIDARPAAIRARAVGAGHAFKQEMDEAAHHALFPSNYPAP